MSSLSDKANKIYNYRIAGNSAVTINAGTTAVYTDFTIPSGYTFMGIVGFSSGDGRISVVNAGVTSGAGGVTARLDITNNHSSTLSVTPKIVALVVAN